MSPQTSPQPEDRSQRASYSPSQRTGYSPSQRAGYSIEELEMLRRSVAMLPTGAWAMKREQSLELLSSFIGLTRTDLP